MVRLDNLTEAVAKGGAVPALLDALTRAERERQTLVRELAALDLRVPQPIAFNPRQVRAELRAYVEQWQKLTAENVRETRGLLETVLRDRIVFRPFDDGDRAMYELRVPLRFDRLLIAAIPVLGNSGRVSVPNGIRKFVEVQDWRLRRESRALAWSVSADPRLSAG